MQPAALAAALALALLLGAAPAESARQGEGAARAWLRQHAAPQADELAELKTANPQAYAIVKALLAKKSLGLLNSKHPSASFAHPGGPAESDAAASGPAAFQALAASGSAVATAAVYPEAPAEPAHHDWLHWKPQQSAVDDEAMVSNVLGAVAELKAGGARGKSLLGQGQSIAPDSVAEAATPASQESSAVEGAPPVQTSAKENSYLAGMGLGAGTAAAAPPLAEGAENPYLAGADLAPAKARPSPRHDSTDYLASFSWDDKPQGRAPARGPAAASWAAPPAATAGAGSPADAASTQAPRHSNALLAWLGGGAAAGPPPQPQPQPEEPIAAENHRNPYMSYFH